MCVRERERDWVILLSSRKLTEHCKPTVMAKIKIIKKKYFMKASMEKESEKGKSPICQ